MFKEHAEGDRGMNLKTLIQHLQEIEQKHGPDFKVKVLVDESDLQVETDLDDVGICITDKTVFLLSPTAELR